MLKQKSDLPVYQGFRQDRSKCAIVLKTAVVFSSFVIVLFIAVLFCGDDTLLEYLNGLIIQRTPINPDTPCPLVKKVDISKYLYREDTISKILEDETFKNTSIEKLLGAIKIPTQIYDDMINPKTGDTLDELFKREPLWKPFEEFHRYLERTFPSVHKHLKVEKVNKFGLIYTWQGSTEKKPIMLTAHLDVVPIQKETIHQWNYPPFEGGYDGEYLYGRGSSDCKNLLIGILESVELLINEGEFKPERTILLAFGYDEEASGTGADEISKVLIDRYGPNSLFQIIDEGNEGFTKIEDVNLILPATAEKGHVDSYIELYTPGGHSSVPPDHTAIGILSRLVWEIEEHPFESILTKTNPMFNCLQCLAQYSPTIDKDLKSDILKANLDAQANQRVVEHLRSDRLSKYLITTSVAADIINGGVKSNALPEHVSVLINHRVALEESTGSTAEKIMQSVKKIANRFDLGILFYGETIREPTVNGYFNFTTKGDLEPAPVTPANGELWNLYGGTLRYLYENLIYPNSNESFIFSPFLSTGNTDTKSYWDLTPHIFRYQPALPGKDLNIHSVNERLVFKGHQAIIAFYYYYLQVSDATNDFPEND